MIAWAALMSAWGCIALVFWLVFQVRAMNSDTKAYLEYLDTKHDELVSRLRRQGGL